MTAHDHGPRTGEDAFSPAADACPAGRGYLMLPCRHQRAYLNCPDLSGGNPYRRTCAACGIRYSLVVDSGLGGDESYVLVTRLT